MAVSRLSEALAEPGALPSAGQILVLRPGAEHDLSSLPKDRSVIVTGFRPDADRLAAQGWQTATQAEGQFAAALLFLPRARALARALVAEASTALPTDAPIWVDGQKHDGIDTALKDIRARAVIRANLAKAHGRSFAFANPGPTVFADWTARPVQVAPGFVTRPGVFSADGVDPGSALLSANLPAGLKGKGADLGAGWGWLSAEVLKSPAVKELHLVEAEAEALACARQNVPDERAAFHWADATTFAPGHTLDFVVMNPPFHTGRAAEPALGAAFIRAAARLLHPQGRLYMVANRTLPYEEALAASFRQVTPIATDGGFKLFVASHPLKRHADRA